MRLPMPEPSVLRFAGLEAALDERRRAVDGRLRALILDPQGRVRDAVEHALFAPSKRLRPILALLVADLFRADANVLLPAACSIEMVHTASLILDDLPSMDDALMRRGRPACHVAYGEATAILAAFALISRAYQILAEGWPGGPDAEVRSSLARELARAIGLDGMIAGQAMDLAMTGTRIDLRTLEFIHSRKTGALFIASAGIGASGARASAAERAALGSYAKNLGLAFQIVDDLIDATSDSGGSGKDVRKDVRKTTFVSFAGIAGARQLATELVEASQQALAGFGDRAETLRELARYVVTRNR
jgi:geranylgeranyl pyrophosphate synthase